MRDHQLRNEELRPCDRCSKPMMHTGLPLFWTVTIGRQGVDLKACRQHAALAMTMGNNAIARVFTGAEPFTKPVGTPSTLQICESCMTEYCGMLLVLEQCVRESLDAKKPNPPDRDLAAASSEASGSGELGTGEVAT